MPEFIRLTIADALSQRYTRSSMVIYGLGALCFALFAALMTAFHPSLLMYVMASMAFMLGFLVCILRNPLGILTMRAQKKLAAREFIFTPEGFTVANLSGQALHYKKPQADLIFLNGPGGCDYYLLVKGDDGTSGTCYVGNNPAEVGRLAELLEQSGALRRFEKPQQPDEAQLSKLYKDNFFK